MSPFVGRSGSLGCSGGAHLYFSSSLKPNSAAMGDKRGAMRFWSAYNIEAVSVKMKTA